jgi:hypothetical protein
MGSYNGLAMFKMGDLQVEVLARIQSGDEQRSGLGWWTGTYSTTDDAGAHRIMPEQNNNVTIEMDGEDDGASPPKRIRPGRSIRRPRISTGP